MVSFGFRGKAINNFLVALFELSTLPVPCSGYSQALSRLWPIICLLHQPPQGLNLHMVGLGFRERFCRLFETSRRHIRRGQTSDPRRRNRLDFVGGLLQQER